MKPYRFNPTDYIDFISAKPGQWFIGVLCMDPIGVYITPVNIFEERGDSINASVVNNQSMRGMNRYASGAPGEKSGKMDFFRTFAAGNWLAHRPIGQTHHTAVMLKNKLLEDKSYGFSIIKINNAFVQVKLTSNSLNTKPDARKSYSYSNITYFNGNGSRESRLGNSLLPKNVEDELVNILKSHPFSLHNIAVSLD